MDAVPARFFSVTRRRAQPLGAEYVLLCDRLEANTIGGKRFRRVPARRA
jgi:hypothetical protein